MDQAVELALLRKEVSDLRKVVERVDSRTSFLYDEGVLRRLDVCEKRIDAQESRRQTNWTQVGLILFAFVLGIIATYIRVGGP